MALPTPRTGLVIGYSYLWRSEARRGREEGTKNRPCVVVLAIERAEGITSVLAAPVTHSPPLAGQTFIEIPAETKRRLGLDEERSWIITDELNRFIWPGADLVPIARDKPGQFEYGVLPKHLTERVIDQVRENLRRHGLLMVVSR